MWQDGLGVFKTSLPGVSLGSDQKLCTSITLALFPRDVGMSRSDVAMNPFIFLLKINGQSILFISILGID